MLQVWAWGWISSPTTSFSQRFIVVSIQPHVRICLTSFHLSIPTLHVNVECRFLILTILTWLFLFGSTLYWCSKVVLCKSMDYSNLHIRWNRHGKWNALTLLVLGFQRDYQNNGIKVIVIRVDIYLLFWQLHAVNCHKVGACSWTPRKLTGVKSSKLVLRRFMTRMYAVI